MARPMVKNTCSWITSDDKPAGMPSFDAEKEQSELATPIARP